MNVLLTGANGFIGRRLVNYWLLGSSYEVSVAVRESASLTLPHSVRVNEVKTLNAETNWNDLLKGVDVVVHAAARVHILKEDAHQPLAAYREVNVAGTLNLARQAIAAGVKRFIFLSSIKVNGESTPLGQPFGPDDAPNPRCDYGQSKYEAEKGLLALAKEHAMEVVIIRPVLVYGPDVKGNFFSMLQWLQKGIPLPLGRVLNRRSFVSVDNLVHFIDRCVTHPNAANQIFCISDGDDISTTMLLKKIRELLGKPTRLIPAPCWLLRSLASRFGKEVEVARLCDSLQVDISKARHLLNWDPLISMDKALQDTVAVFSEAVKQKPRDSESVLSTNP